MVCQKCDRGQRYCSPECSAQARAQSLREAGRRYRRTPNGRQAAARRQRRHRARKKADVTHQGSANQRVGNPQEREVAMNLVVTQAPTKEKPDDKTREDHPAPPPEQASPLCHFCGKSCGEFSRFHFLIPPRRRSRRRHLPRDRF